MKGGTFVVVCIILILAIVIIACSCVSTNTKPATDTDTHKETFVTPDQVNKIISHFPRCVGDYMKCRRLGLYVDPVVYHDLNEMYATNKTAILTPDAVKSVFV